MTQATAELDETATADIPDKQFESDMFLVFADDEPVSQSTTTPTETTEASATPDAYDAFTVKTAEAPESKEVRVDDLPSTVQRLNELDAKSNHSTDSLGERMR